MRVRRDAITTLAFVQSLASLAQKPAFRDSDLNNSIGFNLVSVGGRLARLAAVLLRVSVDCFAADSAGFLAVALREGGCVLLIHEADVTKPTTSRQAIMYRIGNKIISAYPATA